MVQLYVSNALLLIGITLSPVLWLIVVGWFVYSAVRGLYRQLIQIRQLQAMPCHRCVYFSGCEQLQCAVNPYSALTESAKDCKDFTPSNSPQEVIWSYHSALID
ncbi:MAG: hypothetical protein AAF892_07285 [Cyanobacteria bacterium P01_D01_bin.71]